MSNYNNIKKNGNEMMFPLIRCVHQNIKTPRIADLGSELNGKFDEFGLKNSVKPNDTVAITAGSRGINHLDTI